MPTDDQREQFVCQYDGNYTISPEITAHATPSKPADAPAPEDEPQDHTEPDSDLQAG